MFETLRAPPSSDGKEDPEEDGSRGESDEDKDACYSACVGKEGVATAAAASPIQGRIRISDDFGDGENYAAACGRCDLCDDRRGCRRWLSTVVCC